MSKTISIVVPCYNEEAVIHSTLTALTKWCSQEHSSHPYSFEWIFVDDGSSDQTLERMDSFFKAHPAIFPLKIKVIPLSRNHGHQLALTCGLNHSSGDAVISIDADLQDPPEVMSQFLEQWRKGFQIVHGIRKTRAGESSFKRITAAGFYRILSSLTKTKIPSNAGDFRLMDRSVIQVFNSMPEKHRYIRGMIPWAGFQQTEVHYHREARFAGVTHYPLKKMLRLAADAVTSFSVKPLRLSFWFGLGCAGLSAALGFWVFLGWMSGNTVKGWPSLMLAVFFFGSVQLMTLGVIGEYLGRIYEEVKNRPLYIVDQNRIRNY